MFVRNGLAGDDMRLMVASRTKKGWPVSATPLESESDDEWSLVDTDLLRLLLLGLGNLYVQDPILKIRFDFFGIRFSR